MWFHPIFGREIPQIVYKTSKDWPERIELPGWNRDKLTILYGGELKMKRIIILSLVFFIVLCFYCSKSEKEIFRIEKVNGVDHIYNPPLPPKGTVSLDLEKITDDRVASCNAIYLWI